MNKKSAVLIVGSLCFGAFLCGAVASTILNAQNESGIASPSFTPTTFSFLKNLKVGDNNQDVRQLQILLNSDVDTSVSAAGVGSKGQESTYFGQLTANAVMCFQAKNGISSTGFVGVLTRGKLNEIVAAASTVGNTTSLSLATTSSSVGTTSQFSGPLPLVKERLPRLYVARPQQIKRADIFTLIGAGFQTTNTIHIGSNIFPNIVPQDDSNISFVIPASANIQNGTYEVWIENSKGSSKVSGQSVNLTITDSPKSAPVISSVLPVTVSGTDTMTVTGSGFTPTGNDIVSGFGTIKNLSSNGSQISFSPMSLVPADVIKSIGTSMSVIKIGFYITNADGVSNIPGSVDLKL